MATEQTITPTAEPPLAARLDTDAARLYDTAAVLNALGDLGRAGFDEGTVDADTVQRLAEMAHRDLLGTIERIYEVRDALRAEVNRG